MRWKAKKNQNKNYPLDTEISKDFSPISKQSAISQMIKKSLCKKYSKKK